MWNNVINAWWPLVFYPATDAPRFTKGMWAMIGTAIATLLVTALVYYLEQREKQERRAVEEECGPEYDRKEPEDEKKEGKEYHNSLQ